MMREISWASANSLAMLSALVTTVSDFSLDRIRAFAISAVVVPESRIMVSPGFTNCAAAWPMRAFSYRGMPLCIVSYSFAFACFFACGSFLFRDTRPELPNSVYATGVSMKLRYLLATLAALATLVLCSSVFVYGQGTDLGTIRGTVTDSTGALVANASVTILDVRTSSTRHTTTNSRGEYQMFGLPSGTYKVTLAIAGMSTVDITGVVLNGSDVATANGVLKVASTAEQVVVTAEAPIIDSADQTISNTITSTAVIDLPRDSRDVYQFLYLNPNITQGVDSGEFKFLGFQSYGANFTIDGQRSTNTIFGSPTTSEPSLEAVSELNVLSNDFSAEYAGIANIRITTKRGENQFHGSVFYNNKNSALAAWQTQDIIAKQGFLPTQFQSKFPTPYFNFNDLGGSFGGPIPKLNKTWFFMAYERNYSRSPVSFSSNKIPHPS